MGISLMFTDNVDALGFMANKATTQINMKYVLMYSLSLLTQKHAHPWRIIHLTSGFICAYYLALGANRTINTERIATSVLQAESTHLDTLTRHVHIHVLKLEQATRTQLCKSNNDWQQGIIQGRP